MYRQSLSIRLHEQSGLAVARSQISTSEIGDADIDSGYIYVLRPLARDPQIAGIADLHKIGFSRDTVEKRIKNAEKSPTYLMAPSRSSLPIASTTCGPQRWRTCCTASSPRSVST